MGKSEGAKKSVRFVLISLMLVVVVGLSAGAASAGLLASTSTYSVDMIPSNGNKALGSTATATCAPVGAPAPFVVENPAPLDLYGPVAASDGTYAYVEGGLQRKPGRNGQPVSPLRSRHGHVDKTDPGP